MDPTEISDEFSDWEQVTNPFDYQQPPSSPPNPNQLEFRLELRENYYSDESSIFPPTEHEGLPLLPTDYKSSGEDTMSVSSLPRAISDTSRPSQDQIKPDSKLLVIIRDIKVGISTVKGIMLTGFGTNFRCRIRSMRLGSIVVPGGILALALFACFKFLQWKNRLLLLIREKDQKISQLLSQIAHMNEILSARRKVPILRIN